MNYFIIDYLNYKREKDGLLYKNKKWFTEEEFRKLIK